MKFLVQGTNIIKSDFSDYKISESGSPIRLNDKLKKLAESNIHNMEIGERSEENRSNGSDDNDGGKFKTKWGKHGENKKSDTKKNNQKIHITDMDRRSLEAEVVDMNGQNSHIRQKKESQDKKDKTPPKQDGKSRYNYTPIEPQGLGINSGAWRNGSAEDNHRKMNGEDEEILNPSPKKLKSPNKNSKQEFLLNHNQDNIENEASKNISIYHEANFKDHGLEGLNVNNNENEENMTKEQLEVKQAKLMEEMMADLVYIPLQPPAHKGLKLPSSQQNIASDIDQIKVLNSEESPRDEGNMDSESKSSLGFD